MSPSNRGAKLKGLISSHWEFWSFKIDWVLKILKSNLSALVSNWITSVKVKFLSKLEFLYNLISSMLSKVLVFTFKSIL